MDPRLLSNASLLAGIRHIEDAPRAQRSLARQRENADRLRALQAEADRRGLAEVRI